MVEEGEGTGNGEGVELVVRREVATTPPKIEILLLRRQRGKHGTKIVKTRHHHPETTVFKMEDVPNQHNGKGPVQTNVMDGINAGGLQSRRCLRKKQVQEGRNRASPARLVRLNKILDQTQRDLIENEYFMGGIVKIETTTMPADLSRWVLQRYKQRARV